MYYKIFKISKEKDNIRVEKEKEIQKISLWTKDLDQIIKEKNMELNSIKNKIFNLSDDVFSIYIRLEFINRNYFLRNIKKVLTGKLTYKSIIHKILKKVFPTSIVNKIEKFYYSKNINKVENNNFILNLQNEKTLYVFPVIDWYFRIQRPQQIAKSFLNNGYVIIYFKTKFNICSTPGYISELIDNKIINVTLFLNEEKNIYKEKLSDENLDFLLQGIMKFEKDFLINKRLSIVDHPFWFPLSKKLSGNFNIYDCMDYHPGFGDESKYLIELEEMAMTQSELLVLSSSDLYKRFSNKNKNSILVRNGCEFEFFNKRPENIYKSKYEKIIGYYGAISSWFDTDIIVDLALHFSNYEFLLVGSTLGCENIEKIKEIKNITLIGEVEYTELTKYLYSFDVAIMPFRINELTIATNPVKVYEYLCSGVPVVSTKLPEVEVMNEVVYTAISVDDFISQINMALTTIDEDSRKKRVNFAKNNDWYSRFLDIKNKIIEINIKMPKVSIILVTYNNLNFTKECLESMEKYNNYANCEIIVVDNLSQDGTRDFLKKYEESHSNFKAILHDSNSGFAAGNNIGINNATGDYIILLNNDTKVTPNWIQNLIKHFDYDSNIGIVGPRTNNIGNESRIKTNYSNTVEMIEFSYDIYYKNISKQYNIPVLAFFCVVMKKELINKVGILDEIFGIGMFEDDDYCMRVKEQGYKLICADDVFIHHHLGASFDKNPEWKQQLFKKNKAIYEKKWGKWKEHSYRKDIK